MSTLDRHRHAQRRNARILLGVLVIVVVFALLCLGLTRGASSQVPHNTAPAKPDSMAALIVTR